MYISSLLASGYGVCHSDSDSDSDSDPARNCGGVTMEFGTCKQGTRNKEKKVIVITLLLGGAYICMQLAWEARGDGRGGG
jgi:hypothetical protein